MPMTEGAALYALLAAGWVFLRRRRARRAGPGVFQPPAGDRDPDIDVPGEDPIPGSGPIRPGPGNSGPPPGPRGWGGGQYGPGPIPENFDWNAQFVWISPNCSTVAEGALFLPHPRGAAELQWWLPRFVDADDVRLQTQRTLANALLWLGPMFVIGPHWPHLHPEGAIVPAGRGTAWGHIARQVAEAQRKGDPIDPEELATRLVADVVDMQAHEISPSCLEPVDQAWAKLVTEQPNMLKEVERWPKVLQEWRETLVERVEYGLGLFLKPGAGDVGPYWDCCDDGPGIPFDVG